MPITGSGTYVSILKHCFCFSFIQQEFSLCTPRLLHNANKSVARRDDCEVHTKTTLLIHPKHQCICTHRLLRCLSLHIISISHVSSTRYINHQVPHLVNPGGFPAHSEKCISQHVIQGSQRVHKAQISHENQCKQSKSNCAGTHCRYNQKSSVKCWGWGDTSV